MPTYHFIPADSVLCSAHAKFKFCFLDLLGFFFFFFPNIFSPWLVETTDANPMGMEGQL